MADFSANDINEAKRRVREMQSKARDYVSAQENNPHFDSKAESKTQNKESKYEKPKPDNDISSLLSGLFSKDDSSLLLALILLLSKEKADNMLILALLYILM